MFFPSIDVSAATLVLGGEDLSPPGGPLVLLPGETPSTSAPQREEKNLGDVFVFPFSRLVF